MSLQITLMEQSALERAQKLLALSGGELVGACARAAKRAGEHGNTVGGRMVSEKYVLTQGQVKRHAQQTGVKVSQSSGACKVTFGYRGKVIPLLQFDTSFSEKNGVRARVLRGNSRKRIERAFMASSKFGGTVFRREGSAQYPIKPLYGPAVPHVFSAHVDVREKMGDEIESTFDKRIDHELSRILSKW